MSQMSPIDTWTIWTKYLGLGTSSWPKRIHQHWMSHHHKQSLTKEHQSVVFIRTLSFPKFSFFPEFYLTNRFDAAVSLSSIRINLLAFFHECHSLIGYATHYLFCAVYPCYKMMAACLRFLGVCEKGLDKV